MQIKQNPFSFYDFLGYLIPGSVLLLCVFSWLLMEGHFTALTTVMDSENGKSLIANISWMIPFGFTLAAYVVGFVLALVSSLVVERYLILRKGYPSKYRFHKVDTFFAKKGTWEYLDGICLILALPIVLVDIIMGVFLGLDKKYYVAFKPKEIIFAKPILLAILKKIHPKHDISLEDADFNWHQYIYHYVYEHETQHASKIQNYVALYGFSRTCSMVFVLLAWITPVAYYAGWVNYSCKSCFSHIAFFSLMAYFFFLGFAKFFRRYTDEIIMAAIALETKNKHAIENPVHEPPTDDVAT